MAGRQRRLDARTALGPADVGGEPGEARGADLAELAAEAFVYGLPLVSTLARVERLAEEGIGPVPAAPLNGFGHAEEPAGPDGGVALIEADVLHSVAAVDVSGGPVELEVPESGGRYYVLQLLDAWANSFAYVGRRATGGAAGSFLLVERGYDGPAQGATLIRCPTALVTIVGRWPCGGDDDRAAARRLREGLSLTPLGRAGAGLPHPAMAVAGERRFFEQLRVGMRAFPPAARDLDHQRRFAALGLAEIASPFADPTEELADALAAGLAAGSARLGRAQAAAAPGPHGWRPAHHACDFNLDFFELGTRDEPAWKHPDPHDRHLARALAARDRPWGCHGYEVAELSAEADGEGRPLEGAHRYDLRLPAPPADGHWSVTVYDADSSLAESPIGRHSVGALTPGLDRAADGSATISIQAGEPGEAGARANWLPAPAAHFRLVLRMYEPREEVLRGEFEPPPVRRVG